MISLAPKVYLFVVGVILTLKLLLGFAQSGKEETERGEIQEAFNPISDGYEFPLASVVAHEGPPGVLDPLSLARVQGKVASG